MIANKLADTNALLSVPVVSVLGHVHWRDMIMIVIGGHAWSNLISGVGILHSEFGIHKASAHVLLVPVGVIS